MARALWKGAISFGLVTIPVALYPAGDSRSSVTFHLLHKSDLTRIHNRRVDEEDHEVPYDEVVKGYEYEKDRYVVITEDDLEKANVDATRSIDIMHFVAADEIDIAYYDTPYYTEPAKAGRKAYALLRETLQRTGKVGVAKLVIRERQHLCVVLPDGLALLAYTLRWPYQLRDPAEFDLPSHDLDKANVSPQELKMAEQVVDIMTVAWSPEQYRDTYREDIMGLIEEKVRTGKVTAAAETPHEAAEGTVVDILALLQRSMEQREASHSSADATVKAAAASGARGRRAPKAG
jgi:DNA end-binding protein Ku